MFVREKVASQCSWILKTYNQMENYEMAIIKLNMFLLTKWNGLRENWNQKTPYFMGLSMVSG